MKIGFTGTKHGMSKEQAFRVHQIFAAYLVPTRTNELHHGDCVGADAEAADIARRFATVVQHVHPPTDPKLRANKYDPLLGDVLHEAKDYIARDHDIVDETEVLVATPRTLKEERRSGTWATIRHARKQGKPVVIVSPDGAIVHPLAERAEGLASFSTQDRVEAALQEALEALWEPVGRYFPEATAGDFGPEETIDLENAVRRAIDAWVYYNVPGAAS